MALYKPRKSKYWRYKFVWKGETMRESTKQANKRVAEQDRKLRFFHRFALSV